MPDAFDILGVPARFDLDAAAVQRAFLARSAEVHPDRTAGDEELAAELNAARQTLNDPERRANALLARLGGPSKEADRSLPDGFLMGMMSLREQAEAASGDPAQLEHWMDEAERRRRAHIETTGAAFAAIQRAGSAPSTPSLRDIRRELNAWRYIERMIEQLQSSDGGRGPGPMEGRPG